MVSLFLTEHEEGDDARPNFRLFLVDQGRQGRSHHEEGHHWQRQDQPLAAAEGVDGSNSRQTEDEVHRSYISNNRLE